MKTLVALTLALFALGQAPSYDARDLSGIWWARTARGSNFSLSATSPPMTPWAQRRHDAAKPGLGPRGKPLGNDPMMICDPMGYPRIMFWTNYPIEIIQRPERRPVTSNTWAFLPRPRRHGSAPDCRGRLDCTSRLTPRPKRLVTILIM